MREVQVKKFELREADKADESAKLSPQQTLGMMWRLALDVWSFKEGLRAEPRLQRHVVVVERRGR
ncbi:MAG: hypothetical protein ACRD9R_01320 [Pyrinomonadaceae bacterium]